MSKNNDKSIPAIIITDVPEIPDSAEESDTEEIPKPEDEMIQNKIRYKKKEKSIVLPLLPRKSDEVLDDESKRRLELSRILMDNEKTLNTGEKPRRRQSSSGSLFRWDTEDNSEDPVLHIASRLNIHRDAGKTAGLLKEMTRKELEELTPPSSRKSSIPDTIADPCQSEEPTTSQNLQVKQEVLEKPLPTKEKKKRKFSIFQTKI